MKRREVKEAQAEPSAQPASAESAASSSNQGEQLPDYNAAAIAAMEAAKKLSLSMKSTSKPRMSRFSNSLLTKKVYFPPQSDINYAAIFNGPFRVEVETDTHTTITVGGKEMLVTEMDEPLHVLISASNEETLNDALERVNSVFTQPDLARRLAQKSTKLAEAPAVNSVVTAIPSIFDQNELNKVTETETIQVPFAIIGLIIGKNGENKRHLQEIFNVQLRIQQDNEVTTNFVMRDVTIRGTREMIDKTKNVIQTLIETQKGDIITHLQSSREGFEKVAVPNDKVGLVIGRQGCVIKELMSKTSTQIQVPREPDKKDPTKRYIIITGDPQNVLDAKKQIQDIIDGQMGSIPPGMPVSTITVPDDKVGLVIGKGGTIIKDIQLRSGAYIQIPGKPLPGVFPPVRVINIAGTEEQQQLAKAEIQKMIGTTAGTGHEYKEVEEVPRWDPMAQMRSMLASGMDFSQMEQYMQMQYQMGSQDYYRAQQSGMAPGPQPTQPVSAPASAPAPEVTSKTQETEKKEEVSPDAEEAPPGVEEAPPGVDDDEAPPGL